MMPSKNRITQKEFKTFFSMGRSIPYPLFTLVWGHIPSDIPINIPKCAVVTPKSVSKKAVDRNRIRRQIYSLLSKNKKSLQNKTFYIFLTKKPIILAPFDEIAVFVEKALLKTKI